MPARLVGILGVQVIHGTDRLPQYIHIHGTHTKSPNRSHLEVRVERQHFSLEVVARGPVAGGALLQHVLAGAGAIPHLQSLSARPTLRGDLDELGASSLGARCNVVCSISSEGVGGWGANYIIGFQLG